MKKSMLMLSMTLILITACGSGSDYQSSNNSYTESNESGMKSAEYAPDPKDEMYPATEEAEMEDSEGGNGTHTISATNANGSLAYEWASPGVKSKPMLNERMFSSAAVAYNVNDSLRPFIITADLRFRVENVEKSTYAIEDAIISNKGYVESSQLSSRINSQRTITISRDSSVEQINYVLENRMTLRVPANKLDKVLRTIGAESEYFEHRNITANNIRFDLIEKDLRKKRLARFQARLGKAIDDKGKKLESIERAEERILHSEEMADHNTVDLLRQLDRVEYSTIEVFIYQHETVYSKKRANPDSISQYEPSFWSRMGDALYEGWEGVLNILVALARGWFVILVAGAVIWYAIRSIRRTQNKP